MKFLKQVADYYIRKSKAGLTLADCTMVLPNKRSAAFLSKYIKQGLAGTTLMPRFTTITAFTQEFCRDALCPQSELLFILYKCYKSVLEKRGATDQIRDFDKFVYWGGVVLDDFNLIDSHLVDTDQLFRNIREERKIESYHLTLNQIDAAKKIGVKKPLDFNPDSFWKHLGDHSKSGSAAEKFINIWEILAELYDEFHKELAARHIAYSGMQAREAAKNISALGRDDFNCERIAFIGFYVLSESRKHIFRHLRSLGIADFFWDDASPLLSLPGSRAGSNIRALSRMLPAPEDFSLEPITAISQIQVCPVASNLAQTKVAAAILKEWKETPERRASDKFEPVDDAWALVLPNEKLLAPMLTSLPPGIGRYNVAMRTSFANTPFSSLISSIIRLQENARKRGDSFCYFYKDVLEILSHPYIATIASEQAEKIKQLITRHHLYNVDASELTNGAFDKLEFIFRPISDMSDVKSIHAYLINLFDSFISLLNIDDSASAQPYEAKILADYRAKADEICRLSVSYKTGMHHTTFFKLLRRILAAQDIKFDGNPVTGLQILGMQDARVLDFDKLIITSLNEKILPQKATTPSFIPPVIRKGFNIPTVEDEEENIAYQFYRIISRAQKICLIYDSRTPDLSMGEMSRYLRQLMILMPDHIVVRDTQMGVSPGDKTPLSIKKDDKVIEELNSFLTPGGLNFSASALKAYLKCPLLFYLQNVKGLNTNDFDPEYMDASSYGSIMHSVAEIFYKKRANRIFDIGFYNEILKSPTLYSEIKNITLMVMDQIYYHGKYSESLASIPGEGRVLAKLITSYVIAMLHCEAAMMKEGRLDPFKVYAVEDKGGKKIHRWKLADGLTVNFTMSIDRIDEVCASKKLRFIDYKTGNDDIKKVSVDQLFTPDFGAMFQLLAYSIAYAEAEDSRHDIQPVVYLFRSMASGSGICEFNINGQHIDSYKQVAEEFRARLVELIKEILNPDIDFYPTPDEKKCQYCVFTEICGRTAIKS